MGAIASVSAIELQEGQKITIHFKGLDGKVKAIYEIGMGRDDIDIYKAAGASYPVNIRDWKSEENGQ